MADIGIEEYYNQIKTQRKALHLRQEPLAKLAKTTQAMICSMERKRKFPGDAIVFKITEILKLDPGKLWLAVQYQRVKKANPDLVQLLELLEKLYNQLPG